MVHMKSSNPSAAHFAQLALEDRGAEPVDRRLPDIVEADVVGARGQGKSQSPGARVSARACLTNLVIRSLRRRSSL